MARARAAPVLKHRFTVEEYHRMGEAGIFRDDDRVELIEGEIVEMPPIGAPHNAIVARLNELFGRALRDRAIVFVQGPVRQDEYSEPQPDLALARRRPDFYATAHPTPEDTLLIVEVADTTLRYDRDVKVPLYARSGVPEVWLVDLNRRSITVYRDPAPDGYRDTRIVSGDEQVAPQSFPDLVLSVSQILNE